MSTLAANKYNEAVQQVKNLDGVKVPKEISAKEKNHYHVLVIKSKPNAKTMKFEHEVKTQVINPESFEKNKNTYKQLGYSNMVIFHNPILQKQIDDEAKAKVEAEAKADAKAKAQKELEEEAKAEAKAEAEANKDKK